MQAMQAIFTYHVDDGPAQQICPAVAGDAVARLGDAASTKLRELRPESLGQLLDGASQRPPGGLPPGGASLDDCSHKLIEGFVVHLVEGNSVLRDPCGQGVDGLLGRW